MKLNSIIISAAIALGGIAALTGCSAQKEKEQAQETSETTENADQQAVTVLEKGATIAKEADKLVVIDFNATWCGPCRQFAPTFDKVAEEYTSKAKFYSVDVDVHPELAAQYEVQSIPMVVYIKPDGSYTSTVGLISEADFTAAINAAL